MQVISIQSQVAYGHVGNSAAAFPMQLGGLQVVQVPTTLLSNHPHYATMRGRMLESALVSDLLRGVEERGLVDTAAIILTGYMGSVETARIVANFIRRAKERNPSLFYVCDPVMGDDDLGVFVADGLPEIMRSDLVPLADLITPNQFEFEMLAGMSARDEASLLSAAELIVSGSGKQIVVTGCHLTNTPDNHVEVVTPQGGHLYRVAAPRLPIRPCGTGDLFTGLLVVELAKKTSLSTAMQIAAGRIRHVLERTMKTGSEEMRLDALLSANSN